MSAPKPRLAVDATRERLLALGCGYAAERRGDLLGEAVRAAIAPHAFLDQLLAAELSGREERRVKTSLKVSNLPLGQTLENVDFAFRRSSARASTPWRPAPGSATPRRSSCRARRASARVISASGSASRPCSSASRCSTSASTS
jgi:hypothetical protein